VKLSHLAHPYRVRLLQEGFAVVEIDQTITSQTGESQRSRALRRSCTNDRSGR
jgi:hypothetical protein